MYSSTLVVVASYSPSYSSCHTHQRTRPIVLTAGILTAIVANTQRAALTMSQSSATYMSCLTRHHACRDLLAIVFTTGVLTTILLIDIVIVACETAAGRGGLQPRGLRCRVRHSRQGAGNRPIVLTRALGLSRRLARQFARRLSDRSVDRFASHPSSRCCS